MSQSYFIFEQENLLNSYEKKKKRKVQSFKFLNADSFKIIYNKAVTIKIKLQDMMIKLISRG